jgi:hypothetical protein
MELITTGMPGMHIPGRIIYGTPIGYRLVRRNGELALQACYRWQEGAEVGSYWEDIPTVDLPQEEVEL